jgi:hypothetical protein
MVLAIELFYLNLKLLSTICMKCACMIKIFYFGTTSLFLLDRKLLLLMHKKVHVQKVASEVWFQSDCKTLIA